jgi:hypothetical protein
LHQGEIWREKLLYAYSFGNTAFYLHRKNLCGDDRKGRGLKAILFAARKRAEIIEQAVKASDLVPETAQSGLNRLA